MLYYAILTHAIHTSPKFYSYKIIFNMSIMITYKMMNQTFAVNFLVEDLKRKKNQKIMMEE